MHSNEEYSRFDHLSYHSATVKVGQSVKAGKELARVGLDFPLTTAFIELLSSF
jgi:murein DD-endopeptidase MepM/ murein hydrolase activator NlpD